MNTKCIFQLVLLFLIIAFASVIQAQDSPSINQGLLGRWVRADGGYILELKKVRFDGSIEASYFNPYPVSVSEAKVTKKEGLIKVYVKLSGKGYPGSYYSLYYSDERNAFEGVYYQAALGQTFEVVFYRDRAER